MSATATAEPQAANLDYAWIERLLAKRQAQFSNVLAVHSQDPKRIRQMIAYLQGQPGYGEHRLYHYAPWDGLMRFDREDGDFQPVARESGEYDRLAGLSESASDLQSSLRQMDEQLKSEPTILLLEGLEAEQTQTPVVQAVQSWAHSRSLTARGSMAVLFAGDLGEILDNLTQQQVATFRPPLADAGERTWQIRHTAEALRTKLTDHEVHQLSQASAGLNLHQLEAVLTEAYDRSSDGRLTQEAVGELKAEFIKRSQVVEVEEPSWGFESVGGYWAVKRFIQENVIDVLQEHERADRFGVPLPRGLLLFGPPGTGKTLYVKALAQETNLPFINLRTENLFSMWLGESGRKFGEAIRLAEQMSPAIVFIDEIDRFGKRSGGGADGASQETQRVFSQILEWLGDRKRRSIIVGTTNTPDHLDEAFLRAGRFDYKVPFLYPGEEARREILAIHLGLCEGSELPAPPWQASEAERNRLLAELAQQTQDLTGAELEQLALRARRNAFRSDRDALSSEDLDRALKAFQIDGGRAEQKQRFLDQAAQYTDDASFLEALREEAFDS